VIGTLAVEGWAVTFGTARTGLGRAAARPDLFFPVPKVTSNNTELVHWLFMGGLLHLVQGKEACAGCSSAQSPPAVPKVTAHPSTASVPTLYYSMWHFE